MSRNAVRVVAQWDTQDASNVGWHAIAYDSAGEVVLDSVKILFPVDVDSFGREQASELLTALLDAYPGAEVEVPL